MAYTPQTWVDNVSAGSATRFNYMEAGIQAANDLQPGDVKYVPKNPDGTWPSRPTSRTDVMCIWKGPLPAPAIVSSGTGGALTGVDEHHIT